MISFKTFIRESAKQSFKTTARNALATAMVSGGILNTMDIPVQQVPSIVGSYWRRTIAPTEQEQATDIIKKHQHLLTVNAKGKKSLDVESIPAKDREKLLRVQKSGM